MPDFVSNFTKASVVILNINKMT